MKSSNFQLIVLGIFVTLILVGAGIFATRQASGGVGVGKVVIWGTLDQGVMDQALQALRSGNKAFAGVTYAYKDPGAYQSELVDAMAAGQGPDLFFVTPETATTFINKVQIIPYSAISQQAFTTAYVDEGSLFLTSQGPLALPILLDPLVMYINRDSLAAASVAQAPTSWDSVLSEAPQLTSAPSNGSSAVQKSAVALGSWNNIPNAKQLYLTLAMQAGDPIVGRDSSGAPELVFGDAPSAQGQAQTGGQSPATAALQFFTEFSNPNKVSYSWNRSQPQAQDAFVAGKLALYFGFASEYPTLLLRNPNLHTGVAVLPQVAGGTRLTYGRMVGVAITRTSLNPSGALAIAQALASQAGVTNLATASRLPPVRRDVTFDTSGNAAMSVFVQSALMARAWLDPNPVRTDDIFKTMIESVVTGAAEPDSAVAQAAQALQLLYRNQNGGAQ